MTHLGCDAYKKTCNKRNMKLDITTNVLKVSHSHTVIKNSGRFAKTIGGDEHVFLVTLVKLKLSMSN